MKVSIKLLSLVFLLVVGFSFFLPLTYATELEDGLRDKLIEYWTFENVTTGLKGSWAWTISNTQWSGGGKFGSSMICGDSDSDDIWFDLTSPLSNFTFCGFYNYSATFADNKVVMAVSTTTPGTNYYMYYTQPTVANGDNTYAQAGTKGRTQKANPFNKDGFTFICQGVQLSGDTDLVMSYNNQTYQTDTGSMAGLTVWNPQYFTLLGSDKVYNPAGGAYRAGRGCFDDVMLFNDVLSEEEVSTLRNLTASFDIVGITSISNSTWNVTSSNVVGNRTVWDQGEAVNVTSDLVSLAVTASEASNMSCSLTNANYTTMLSIESNYKSATTDATSHAYTLYDSITLGSNTLYCSFIASDGTGENTDSHSGPLLINYQDLSPPNPEYISRYPADIEGLNALFGEWFNYNITDNIELNTTWLQTSSNSTDNIMTCIIEDCKVGTQTNFYDSVTINGNYYNYTLDENMLYGGLFNLDHEYMEDTPHTEQTLGNTNSYIKINISNMSSLKEINLFEIMANYSGPSPSQLGYCNITYTSGNPSISPYCEELPPLTNYNHSHSSYQQHTLTQFSIIDNKIGDTTVTEKGYFTLRGVAQDTYFYTTANNTGTAELSTNSGTGWIMQTYTVDSHLHQFNQTDFYQINACANDSVGNVNCSISITDTFGFDVGPPSSPDVYKPSGIVSGTIDINWTASIPATSQSIVYYDLNIYDLVDSLEEALGNQTTNLSNRYDTSGLSDGSYKAKVTAYTNTSLIATGESEIFLIDGTDPIISNPGTNTTLNSSIIKIFSTLTDGVQLNGWRFGTNNSGTWNITSYQNISTYTTYTANFTIDPAGHVSDESIGYYFEVIDMAGNNDELNTSFLLTSIVIQPPKQPDAFGVGQCPNTVPGALMFAIMLAMIVGLIIYSEIANIHILNFLSVVLIFIQSWLMAGCSGLFATVIGLSGIVILARGIAKMLAD